MQVVAIVLGLAGAALNLVYWWCVARRWEPRFRRWCESRYRVTITLGHKGHWTVIGDGSWLRRFAIEWLQLAYFMSAFVVWAAALLVVLVALG
jgi:hypothetical protein